jgi:hypothetical protein
MAIEHAAKVRVGADFRIQRIARKLIVEHAAKASFALVLEF